MDTIQVVLDSALLRAANGAARRARMNRSALIRKVLRAYLEGLVSQDLEARDRAGYTQHPDASSVPALWEGVAVWPMP